MEKSEKFKYTLDNKKFDSGLDLPHTLKKNCKPAKPTGELKQLTE